MLTSILILVSFCQTAFSEELRSIESTPRIQQVLERDPLDLYGYLEDLSAAQMSNQSILESRTFNDLEASITGAIVKIKGVPEKLSILSMDDARFVFEVLYERTKVPFIFTNDGCYARAHHMAIIMDALGVSSGKIFLSADKHINKRSLKTIVDGKEYEWSWHVAPFIVVRQEDGQLSPMVLDPSVAPYPLLPDTWISKINLNMKPANELVAKFSTRYNYTSPHSIWTPTDYSNIRSTRRFLRSTLKSSHKN